MNRENKRQSEQYKNFLESSTTKLNMRVHRLVFRGSMLNAVTLRHILYPVKAARIRNKQLPETDLQEQSKSLMFHQTSILISQINGEFN